MNSTQADDHWNDASMVLPPLNTPCEARILDRDETIFNAMLICFPSDDGLYVDHYTWVHSNLVTYKGRDNYLRVFGVTSWRMGQAQAAYPEYIPLRFEPVFAAVHGSG